MYKLIPIKEEYPSFTGPQQWLLVSDLTERELLRCYPHLLSIYPRCVHLNEAQGAVLHSYRRNEQKHQRRYRRGVVPLSLLPFLRDPSPRQLSQEEKVVLQDALKTLPPAQHRRIVNTFLLDIPIAQQAKEEGVSRQTIYRSNRRALNRLRQYLYEE